MSTLAITVVFNGCKDEETTQPPATPTYNVKLEDGEIDMPTAIKAGKVIFNVTNAGTQQHRFEVERTSDGSEVETRILNAGESQSLEVTLTATEYEFYCPMPDHKAAGEVHEFDVTQ